MKHHFAHERGIASHLISQQRRRPQTDCQQIGALPLTELLLNDGLAGERHLNCLAEGRSPVKSQKILRPGGIESQSAQRWPAFFVP